MDWDLAQFPMPVKVAPDEEVMPLFQRLLVLARRLLGSRRPLTDHDSAITCFGLAALASRQALAFDHLYRAGMHDQSVTIARSIYESLINLRTAMAIRNQFVDGQALVLTPEQVEAMTQDRIRLSELFLDFRRATNMSLLNKIERAKQCTQAQIDSGTQAPSASGVVASCQSWIDLHKVRVEGEYLPYKDAAGNHPAVPPVYWNGKSPTASARDANLSLDSIYGWCCSFSHSNSYAVRMLLNHDKATGKYGAGNSAGMSVGLVYFAAFCLRGCLHACFHLLTDFEEELKEIENLLLPE